MGHFFHSLVMGWVPIIMRDSTWCKARTAY